MKTFEKEIWLYYAGYILEGRRYNVPVQITEGFEGYHYSADQVFNSIDYKVACGRGDSFVFRKKALFEIEEGQAWDDDLKQWLPLQPKYTFLKFID